VYNEEITEKAKNNEKIKVAVVLRRFQISENRRLVVQKPGSLNITLQGECANTEHHVLLTVYLLQRSRNI
jgi:hypothetical protein